jgi:hypothetical protein
MPTKEGTPGSSASSLKTQAQIRRDTSGRSEVSSIFKTQQTNQGRISRQILRFTATWPRGQIQTITFIDFILSFEFYLFIYLLIIVILSIQLLYQ